MGKARAYPIEATFRYSRIHSWALALLANIRLGRKGLLGANALTYRRKLSITDAKSFITFGPGWKVLPGTNALAF